MFSLAFLALAAGPLIDPEYPDVSLADAAAFRIEPTSVRAMWLLARDHKRLMRGVVDGWNNGPDVVAAWEGECDYRQRCWYHADDAIYCDHLPVRCRLRALSELKNLIGDADYYAGRLPAPVPSTYKFPDR